MKKNQYLEAFIAGLKRSPGAFVHEVKEMIKGLKRFFGRKS